MNDTLTADILSGTVSLVTGIANSRSIAHSIAKSISDHGGSVIVTYMDEAYRQKVIDCTQDMNVIEYIHYNASNEDSAAKLASAVERLCTNGLDHLVHAMAWSNKDELRGNYYDTTASNFAAAMHISCYSLIQLTKLVLPKLNDGGSVITLTYYGSEKVVQNYNVMGPCKAALESSVRYLAKDLGSRQIRVNAISAGPIKTLAATGIHAFNDIVECARKLSPMKRTVTLQDISGTALFLLINKLSAAVTGQTIYVDCGCNIIGLPDVGANSDK